MAGATRRTRGGARRVGHAAGRDAVSEIDARWLDGFRFQSEFVWLTRSADRVVAPDRPQGIRLDEVMSREWRVA